MTNSDKPKSVGLSVVTMWCFPQHAFYLPIPSRHHNTVVIYQSLWKIRSTKFLSDARPARQWVPSFSKWFLNLLLETALYLRSSTFLHFQTLPRMRTGHFLHEQMRASEKLNKFNENLAKSGPQITGQLLTTLLSKGAVVICLLLYFLPNIQSVFRDSHPV